MGRNTELIRQWTVLQRIAASRGNTIPRLAEDLKVSTRTIRRDLDALQLAGFPVYDESVNGTKFWRIQSKPLGALARNGLTFSELAALYFSRALIECFAGTHLLRDIQSALHKFEAALSPAMKKFLDRLPKVITAKREHAKRQDTNTYKVTAQLLEASLGQHVVSMQYHSRQSRREKVYMVHPYRLIHAQGGRNFALLACWATGKGIRSDSPRLWPAAPRGTHAICAKGRSPAAHAGKPLC